MSKWSIVRSRLAANETPAAGRNERPVEAAAERDRKTSGTLRRTLIGTGIAGLAAALFDNAPARARGGGSPLSSATMSFGSWMTTPPLDRFPNLNPRQANHHHFCPDEVTIKSGGCVNFVIAGLHHVLVYDDGTQPGDIDTNLVVRPTNQPLPMLIADPNRRIYRGPDPSLFPQDRVEVVHFDRPGTYLVVCGVLPHFLEGMYGFVRVLP
jgi:plastocyanin